jgi:S1-C subfamily serine protease
MRRTSIALAGLLWGSVVSGSLFAQPVLNRVEQLLRDQVDAVQKHAGKAPQTAEPGYLGLIADDRKEEGKGVRIVDVVDDGPAAKGGLQKDDLITAIDDQPIHTMEDMGRALQGKPAGTKLMISVDREGMGQEQTITLGLRPRSLPTGKISESLPAPNEAPGLPQGPRLGVRTLPVTEEARQQNNLPTTNGALVISITVGSPASRAGIPLGAVITAVNGEAVETPQELAAAVRGTGGDEIELTFVFRGQESRKTISLAAPASEGNNPDLVLRRIPAAGPGKPQPTAGPVLEVPADPRIAALEARIKELEARLEKLEAATTPDNK